MKNILTLIELSPAEADLFYYILIQASHTPNHIDCQLLKKVCKAIEFGGTFKDGLVIAKPLESRTEPDPAKETVWEYLQRTGRMP